MALIKRVPFTLGDIREYLETNFGLLSGGFEVEEAAEDTFEYDDDGRLTAVSSPVETTGMEYDDQGRITRATTTFSDGTSFATVIIYNNNGTIASIKPEEDE